MFGWVRILALLGVIGLAACDVPTAPPAPVSPNPAATGTNLSPQAAARNFTQVAQTMEPLAERECRRRTQGVNCDFLIVVDDRPNQPPNAYQSLTQNGRPVITFNVALIADARNVDELAFVMGHEAAHHILGHLERQQRNAAAGAVIFSGLATLTGGTSADLRSAQELGALVGSRTYSKEFELEADRLGTIITHRSGYNARRGAQFFNRIPDPGDRFLGTHPPNAQRLQMVNATLAELGV